MDPLTDDELAEVETASQETIRTLNSSAPWEVSPNTWTSRYPDPNLVLRLVAEVRRLRAELAEAKR